MDFFTTLMQIISAVLSAYALIIFIRIILSWIHVPNPGFLKVKAFFNQLTDPYLNMFRRFGFLRVGMFDFSPAFGVIVLYLAIFIANNLSAGVYPTIWHVLIWILVQVLHLAAFMLLFIGIVFVVRLIAMATIKGTNPDWIDRLDRMLFPMVSRFMGLFTGKSVKYSISLGIMAAIFIAGRFLLIWGGGYLVSFLMTLLG